MGQFSVGVNNVAKPVSATQPAVAMNPTMINGSVLRQPHRALTRRDGEMHIVTLTPDSPMFILVSTIRKVGIDVGATVSADQTVQEWGNGLGVRITAPIAKAARFARGLPIKVEVVDGGVFLRPLGKPRLTLAQKLKAFDPAIHGGEVMATGRVGAEVF